MKKIIFVISLLFAAFFINAAAAESDADTITDIQEKQSYENGRYTAGSEGNTTSVKKGEGFDFKVPEIIITGQVDTKIMLKREITSLEDLQSVKNILYEKEKIYMPDYYLKEEALSPKALEVAPDRDFIGQFKFFVGSYTNILADAIVGKAFDKDNKAVLKLTHNNFSNGVIDNVETWDNLNFGDLFYSTRYDFLEAVYRVNLDLSSCGNPYTDSVYNNIFKKEMRTTDVSISANFSGKAGEYGCSGTAGYVYFNVENEAKNRLYKENRTSISVAMDRDFDIEGGRKMKLISSLDFWAAEQIIGGNTYKGVVNFDLLVKGILYFEPAVIQAGLRFKDYRQTENNFYLGFYVNANYDIIPDLSLYAVMDPTMQVPDYTLMMAGKFIYPKSSTKPGTDLLDLRTGINWNVLGMFVDAYWGYKIIDNSLMIDEYMNSRYFVVVNNDIEYSKAGLSVETLKVKNIKLTLGYEYKNIIKSAINQTYMPYNELSLKGSYEMSEWNFNLALKMLSGFYGTSSKKSGAYAVVDASVSRKISNLLTLSGYVNNVLNNNYYLLYYYKEKNINLGVGATLNF